MKTFFLFISLFLSLLKCDTLRTIEGIKTDLINTLDKSIASLNTSSLQWQTTIENLPNEVEKIVGDANDEILNTVKVDIVNCIDRVPKYIGEEFRCNADFVKDRIKYQLLQIKAKLLGKKSQIHPPVVCGITPTSLEIETKLNTIEISGYDLDFYNQNLKVYLEDNDGKKVDVTTHLFQPSHYHWNLNVGQNGIVTNGDSKKIAIYHNDIEIYSIPTIQPRKFDCNKEDKLEKANTPIVYIENSKINLIPKEIEANVTGVFFILGNKISLITNVEIIQKGIKLPDFNKIVEERSNQMFTNDIYFAEDEYIIEKITSGNGFQFTKTYPTNNGKKEFIEILQNNLGEMKIHLENYKTNGIGVSYNFTKIPIVVRNINKSCR